MRGRGDGLLEARGEGFLWLVCLECRGAWQEGQQVAVRGSPSGPGGNVGCETAGCGQWCSGWSRCISASTHWGFHECRSQREATAVTGDPQFQTLASIKAASQFSLTLF